MDSSGVKGEALKIIEGLPDDATWDELMYQIRVRQGVAQGGAGADAGRCAEVR